MSFEDALEDLAAKVQAFAPTLSTEEATKTAVVMPFINSVLGYDVFNPQEVVPEFIADIGMKKGEKVDFAIMRDGQVQMLIEAKRIGDPLNLDHAGQLIRYFHVTNARIGVLTNGQHWHFFTDLDRPNRMDEKPFLRLDLAAIDAYVLPDLKKMTKDAFDLDSVLVSAEELKYVSALKRTIADQTFAGTERADNSWRRHRDNTYRGRRVPDRSCHRGERGALWACRGPGCEDLFRRPAG